MLIDYGADYIKNYSIFSTSDFMTVYQIYVDETIFEDVNYVTYMLIYELCDR